MRISASLGLILASGLLGHSGAQTVDYATAPNGSPGGSPGDGSGGIPPGNPNGAPGSAPFPGNAPGSPGSFPGGHDPNFPPTAPGGLPPNIPGGAPGTFPGSGPGSAPGSSPGGSPANVPGTGPVVVPGGVPGGVPGNVPGAGSVVSPPGSPNGIPHLPQNAPNAPGSPVIGASSLPTCPLTTKTVVVTVIPTGPHGGSGFPAPGRSGPQQTGVPAPSPTKPPRFSASGVSPVVSPFTTLTVDLWGPGSGPGAGTGPGSGNDDTPGSGDSNTPGSGDGSAPGGDTGDTGNTPDSGDGTAPGGDTGNINPDTGAGSGGDIGSDHGSGSGLGGSNDGADSGDLGNSSDDGADSGLGDSANDGVDSGVGSNSNDGTHSPFSSLFPGSNPAPKYSEPAPGGSSGGFPSWPGSNTLGPVPTPFQIPGPSGPGGFPGSQPQNPSQGPVQEASDSLPVTTQAGPQGPGGSSAWFTTVGGGDNAGQPRSPWITVTGQDGLPTVINAPGSPQPSTPWLTITGQDGLPTVITGGDDTVPGQSEPQAPWLTITGQDGLPTVISGGHGTPTDQARPSTPWVTIMGQDGLPTVVSSGDEALPDHAEPHTPWLTITGQDGLPTVIDSPGPNQPSTPWLTITGQNGLPTVISGGQATAPDQPLPSTPWLTVTGQDGRPTVINAPGSPQPSTPWLTITGQDGLPTVVRGGDSTAPGQAQPPSFTGFPQGQGLPSGISVVPLPLPSAPGIPGGSGSQGSDQVLPSGIPFPTPGVPGAPLPGDGSGPGITTCTTFTTTGADGLPTVVDSTWVIPSTGPVAEASSQLPVSGLPQGSLSGIPFDVGSIPTGSFPVPGSPQDDSGNLVATTCTSFTLIGTDGLPTVVHSTWVVPAGTPGSGDSAGMPGPISTGASLPGFPTAGPAGIPTGLPNGLPTGLPTASDLDGATPIVTHASFTVIGSDGLPTVVVSTLVIPGPLVTGSAVIGNPEAPSEALDALPNSITSSANDQASGLPGVSSSGSAGSGVVTGGGITTCTSYTMIGPDGLPTVVDSTWVIPGAIETQPGNPALTSDTFSSGLPSGVPGSPSFVSDDFPSGLPTGVPGQITASPGLPSGSNPNGQAGITTCITYTVLGTDGLPTIIDSTLVIPTGTEPTGTNPGLPSVTGVAQPDSSDNSAGTFASLTTAIIIGPDGKPTLTVQTVIFGDSSALGVSTSAPQGAISDVSSLPPFGPVVTSVDLGPLVTGSPSIDSYGAITSDQSMSGLVADSSADAQGDSVTGTVTGTLTWTVTSVVDSTGGPVFSSGASDPLAPYNTLGSPAPSEFTLWPLSSPPVTLQTSTWTNVVVEETTSYTLKFPLTTLATITVGKRHIRRQEASVWSNSTTSEGSPASTSTASSDASSTSICATGLSIGNTTIDFDNSKAGPLFNPQENVWFSSGFLIAPPTSEQPQPYIPSSGGQLVEFVPPTLSNTTTTGSGDVAQIGMGPHAPSPCFRFDFFGASLGCDAQGNEKWCEFEISAYRWNDASSSEESIAWSEIKQVPACPTFSEGGYELTRIDLDGYTDLSSVLITLRVSQELRVWWGDDFRVGWADNTCDAAACRTHAPTYLMKEEAVADAVRRGVFQWSRTNTFDRIDDAVV